MKKAMLLKRVAVLATAGLLSAGVTANIAAADAQAAAQFRCGFYESGDWAYYGHCDAPPPTDVVINVRYIGGNFDQCVPPGLTVLGNSTVILGAAYTGRLC